MIQKIAIKKSSYVLIHIFLIAISALYFYFMMQRSEPKHIKVGILHSLSGSLALEEGLIIKALTLAFDEINTSHILPVPIETIIVDGQSNEFAFAKQAEKLITEDHVDIIFGCWTSASRKAVKKIIEEYESLLVYPVQYEGLENSNYIIYLGAAPNQQLIPGTIWALQNLGKKVFLVGSDYVFPHVAHEILKELITNLEGTIVGEEYIPLDSDAVESVIEKIKKAQPDLILNTLNGVSNIPFFKELKKIFKNTNMPVMSFSVSQELYKAIGIENIIGTYTCWSYYEDLSNINNHRFLKKIFDTFTSHQVVSDPMEIAYFGAHLWALAQKNRTVTQKNILDEIKKIVLNAAEGYIKVWTNNHTWRKMRIARIIKDGKNEILWQSTRSIKPEPFPNNLLLFNYFSDIKYGGDWDMYLNTLYRNWGNKWSA